MTDDPILFARAARSTLANARLLLEAAEQSAEAGRFGLARSLVIAAMEETAKATDFKSVAIGLASTDPREAPEKRHLSKGDLKGHSRKLLSFGTIALSAMFIGAIAPLLASLARGEPVKVPDESALRPNVNRFIKLIDSLDELPGEREDGLYADVRQGELVDPRNVTEQQYRLRLEDARYCLELSELWVGLELSESELAEIRPALQQIVKIEREKLQGYLEHRRMAVRERIRVDSG